MCFVLMSFVMIMAVQAGLCGIWVIIAFTPIPISMHNSTPHYIYSPHPQGHHFIYTHSSSLCNIVSVNQVVIQQKTESDNTQDQKTHKSLQKEEKRCGMLSWTAVIEQMARSKIETRKGFGVITTPLPPHHQMLQTSVNGISN